MLRHLKRAWLAPLPGLALAGLLHGCGGGGQLINRATRVIAFRPSNVQVLDAVALAPSTHVGTDPRMRVRVNVTYDLLNLQAQRIAQRQGGAPGEREVLLAGGLTGKGVVDTTVTGFIGRTQLDPSAIFVAQSLANDILSEVEGRLRNGVLVVDELEVEDEQTVREAELFGAPSNLNASAKPPPCAA